MQLSAARAVRRPAVDRALGEAGAPPALMRTPPDGSAVREWGNSARGPGAPPAPAAAAPIEIERAKRGAAEARSRARASRNESWMRSI